MKKPLSKPTPKSAKKGIVVKKRSTKAGPRIEYIQFKPIEGDPYKSNDPEIQKKLDILKSMEGMWADKDTSFFYRKHGR